MGTESTVGMDAGNSVAEQARAESGAPEAQQAASPTIDLEQEIEVKVDGVPQRVKIRELRDAYSGKAHVSQEMQRLKQKEEELQSQYEAFIDAQIEAYNKGFFLNPRDGKLYELTPRQKAEAAEAAARGELPEWMAETDKRYITREQFERAMAELGNLKRSLENRSRAETIEAHRQETLNYAQKLAEDAFKAAGLSDEDKKEFMEYVLDSARDAFASQIYDFNGLGWVQDAERLLQQRVDRIARLFQRARAQGDKAVQSYVAKKAEDARKAGPQVPGITPQPETPKHRSVAERNRFLAIQSRA